MTLKKKKNWIIAVALAVVAVIAAAALIPERAKAYSEEYARKLAEENLPVNAQMTGMEQDDEEYEFLYVDKVNNRRYEIEISKATGEIVKLEEEAITTVKAQKAALTEQEARDAVVKTYPKAQILSVALEQEDGGFEYKVRFTDGNYQGAAAIQAETGEMLEVTRKLGQRIIVPNQGTGKSGYLTEAEARSRSESFVKNAAVTDLDLEKKNGRYVYEIELYKEGAEYELELDAKTGEQISLKSKWEGDKEKPITTTSKAIVPTTKPAVTKPAPQKLTEDEVKKILQEKVPGGTVRELELKEDDGRLEYKGEIITDDYEYEFELDAVSGGVLEWEKEKRESRTTREASEVKTTTTKPAQTTKVADEKNLSEEKIREILKKKVSNAEIKSLKLEKDDGHWQYEGTMVTENKKYEFEIDALTGTITDWDEEAIKSGTTPAAQTTISSDKAKSIVLAKIPGAKIVELEKDRDDGRVIYEGEAYLDGIEYEFEIDAYTGTIFKWDADK